MTDPELGRDVSSSAPDESFDWVTSVIRAGLPESPRFAAICDAAALDALYLSRLRYRAASELAGGWTPRPALDYLRSLTEGAGVPLDPVARWAGLPADLSLGAATAVGWGKLARVLGLGSREAVVSYRLTLAASLGLAPTWSLAARSDTTGRAATLDDWERATAQPFTSDAPMALDALHAADRAVRDGFAAALDSGGDQP